MAKRFIDTEIFNDSWFMDLSQEGKLLWIYCFTNCDHAGLLEWNKKLIKFATGINDIERVSKELGKSLYTVNDHLVLLPKYFEYQYPNYPVKRFRAADSALDILIKYDLLDKITLTLNKDFIKSYGKGNGNGNGKKGGVGGKTEISGRDPRSENARPGYGERNPKAITYEQFKKEKDKSKKEES